MKLRRFFPTGIILICSLTGAINLGAQRQNSNIVLIDVGLSSKATVAEMISKICLLKPKVIAIELQFPEKIHPAGESPVNLYEKFIKHGDTTITVEKAFEPGERELINAVMECKSNMVFAYEITEKVFPGGARYSHSSGTITEIIPFLAKRGFVLRTRKENSPDLKSFIAYNDDSTNTFGGLRIHRSYQFGVCTAVEYDSAAALKFLRKNERIIPFNYQVGRKKFKSYSISEILKGKVRV